MVENCDWPEYPEGNTCDDTNEYVSQLQDAVLKCLERIEAAQGKED